MALFTAAQLREIRDVILRHHAGIAFSVFGEQAIDPALEKTLRALGLIPEDAPALITDAYVYGQLVARAGHLLGAGTNTKTIVEFLKLNPQPPLTKVEQAAVDIAARHAGEYVVGLASRVQSAVMAKVTGLEASLTPEKIEEIIRDKTVANRERREAAKQLASDLGHEVKNWTRDWMRIAFTETHEANEQGIAFTLEKDHGDPFVSRIPAATCCRDCARLYLAEDGEPKVFRLSELRRNGSNIGVHRLSWRPVLGATHSWCACKTVHVPAGMVWKNRELRRHGEELKKSYEPCAKCGEYCKVLSGEDRCFKCRNPERYAEIMREAERMKDTLHKSESSHRLHDRYTFQGIPISVENAAGSARHWGDPNSGDSGTTWMQADYGRIPRAVGLDDETLDVYVGPDENASHVYVVNQRKKLGPNRFEGLDEQKVILGCSSEDEARRLYLAHYNDERFLGSIVCLSVPRFRKILAANKGKRLRLVKAFEAGEVQEIIEKAEFMNTSPVLERQRLPFVTPEAGAIPKPRAQSFMHAADLIGLSKRGRKKMEKKLKRRSKDAREALARRGEVWKDPNLVLPFQRPASSHERAQDYNPEMHAQFREQSLDLAREFGKDKAAVMRTIAEEHVETGRVSDLSAVLRQIRKAEPAIVIRAIQDRSVFARAKIHTEDA